MQVKLSMKRILTVLSRRAIHEQCLLAKRLLQQQQKREVLELQRHELEKLLLLLQHKIRLQQQQQQQQQQPQQQQQRSSSSLALLAWQQQLEAAKARHEEILIHLKPLRDGILYRFCLSLLLFCLSPFNSFLSPSVFISLCLSVCLLIHLFLFISVCFVYIN